MRKKISKKQLQAILDRLTPTENICFHEGVFSSLINHDKAVVSVKTEYDFLRGEVQASFLQDISKKLSVESFYIGIKENPLDLVIQAKTLKITWHLTDSPPSEYDLVSLYHIDIESWRECPPDFFYGISELFRVCIPEQELGCEVQQEHYGQLHGKDDYLGVGKGNLICRYHLTSHLPYELMLDPYYLQAILPKLKKRKVLRMARITYPNIEGIIFDFDDLRVFIPETFEKNLYDEWYEDSFYTWEPENKEGFEIQKDLLKVRDLPKPPVCKNLMTMINNHFTQQYPVLFFPMKDIRSLLTPFLMAENLTIGIIGNTLTLSAEDDKVKILKNRYPIKHFGSETEKISLTVRTKDFYKLVSGESLIGLRMCETRNDNRWVVYIKDKNCEYLISSF